MICGYETYVDYVYLKKHFADYKLIWNPNKKYSRLKESSFEKRNDKPFFQKLEKSIPDRNERIEFLISSFLFNNNFWIGDIFNEDVIEFHKSRIKRVHGLENLFQSDMDKIDYYLFDNKIDLQEILLTTATESPIIIRESQQLGLSFETLACLDFFTKFIDLWLPIHPLLKMRRLQLCKYKYVLHIEGKRYDKLNSTFQKIAQSSAKHTSTHN